MGQIPGLRNADGVLDLVITVGDRDGSGARDRQGRHRRQGRADRRHRPGRQSRYVQDGVDPNLIVGAGTEVISGEGLVATAGAIDTHVHFLTPEQVPHALANGVTTLIGGGTGPADGSKGTTCTPGPVEPRSDARSDSATCP